ncbi:MAG: helix-turn-helix transcriptional regulator [Candidatus Nanopelagicales bacterium]|jgi:proteasome accessory factor B
MATDRTERLLNLVICLLGAQRPVSRGALRESIPGYADASSLEAFERMFERDKDELRHMGIPVDTVSNAQGEVEGYRIDPDDYAMPSLSLDPAEWAVLGHAARMWNEAALAAEAGAALRKIEASTGDLSARPDLVSVRPGSGEESLPTLWEAIRVGTAVQFDYLARGRDVAETRHVEPWATAYRGAAWYLIGLSRERGAARAFRLSRIRGRVAILRDRVQPVERDVVQQVIESITEPSPRAQAVVELPARSGTHLKSRAAPRADGRWDVLYADEGILVSQVTEAGGRIIEPASLAEAQRRAIAQVLEVHSG